MLTGNAAVIGVAGRHVDPVNPTLAKATSHGFPIVTTRLATRATAATPSPKVLLVARCLALHPPTNASVPVVGNITCRTAAVASANTPVPIVGNITRRTAAVASANTPVPIMVLVSRHPAALPAANAPVPIMNQRSATPPTFASLPIVLFVSGRRAPSTPANTAVPVVLLVSGGAATCSLAHAPVPSMPENPACQIHRPSILAQAWISTHPVSPSACRLRTFPSKTISATVPTVSFPTFRTTRLQHCQRIGRAPIMLSH